MIQIPKIGLGTWLVPDNEAAATVHTLYPAARRRQSPEIYGSGVYQS